MCQAAYILFLFFLNKVTLKKKNRCHFQFLVRGIIEFGSYPGKCAVQSTPETVKLQKYKSTGETMLTLAIIKLVVVFFHSDATLKLHF